VAPHTNTEAEKTRWPHLHGHGPTKCRAGAIAGAITGLLAGVGLAIALGKEIDSDALRWVVCGLLTTVAAVGGMLTGAIASGCYRDEAGASDRKGP
jgi:hypothetical protein